MDKQETVERQWVLIVGAIYTEIDVFLMPSHELCELGTGTRSCMIAVLFTEARAEPAAPFPSPSGLELCLSALVSLLICKSLMVDC